MGSPESFKYIVDGHGDVHRLVQSNAVKHHLPAGMAVSNQGGRCHRLPTDCPCSTALGGKQLKIRQEYVQEYVQEYSMPFKVKILAQAPICT